MKPIVRSNLFKREDLQKLLASMKAKKSYGVDITLTSSQH